ncbi:MAG TPA: hypothetical protein VLA04_01215 [Verrucomicrobiae bacterium]|nr:hypothetical protein [Verrucomicrobiae bacterium]
MIKYTGTLPVLQPHTLLEQAEWGAVCTACHTLPSCYVVNFYATKKRGTDRVLDQGRPVATFERLSEEEARKMYLFLSPYQQVRRGAGAVHVNEVLMRGFPMPGPYAALTVREELEFEEMFERTPVPG